MLTKDVDYSVSLVGDDSDLVEAWQVQILQGEFSGTTVKFTDITEDNDERVVESFNHVIVSSQDPDALTNNQDFVPYLRKILESYNNG
tara:strand:- start:2160 stop:2423 length:264 start_codon:yes stop_codon:yes gene_type:complete